MYIKILWSHSFISDFEFCRSTAFGRLSILHHTFTYYHSHISTFLSIECSRFYFRNNSAQIISGMGSSYFRIFNYRSTRASDSGHRAPHHSENRTATRHKSYQLQSFVNKFKSVRFEQLQSRRSFVSHLLLVIHDILLLSRRKLILAFVYILVSSFE